MRYKNIECPVCTKRFDESSDVVVCPVCGTPYHRDCWTAAGGCIHEKEHEDGYRWVFPETPHEEEIPQEPQKVTDGVFKNGEGITECPNCGIQNYENDMFCRNCHAPLKNNSEYDKSSDIGGMNAEENNTSDEQKQYVRNTEAMFDSFNRYGLLDPDSLVDNIPVREYAAFVGGKAPGKIIRRISTVERYGKSIAPMFAGLLGPIWFFRRKMIKFGAILSAVLLVLFTAAGLLQITEPYEDMVEKTEELVEQSMSGQISVSDARERLLEIESEYYEAGRTAEDRIQEKASALLCALATYGVPLVGFFGGIGIYRKEIRKNILLIRKECSDMDTYMNELRRRGGTSAGLALVGVLVYAAAFFAYTYFPMICVILD